MKNLSHEEFTMYMEVESAVAPIDDVIRLLYHAQEDFHLNQTSLDELDRIDLLNRYETLGSILKLSVDALEKVVGDINKIGEDRKKDSGDQDQVIG